ncbi:hypothetical protein QG37_02907 [Candidozyma auris]|uniref:Uncharacterized protein n=1 Tax=Candidozyma auris TaxID=498019 RepID=A0A0L0P122_CANAR|nr:hypothetical protein QG37_02907 [[Candida] auris]
MHCAWKKSKQVDEKKKLLCHVPKTALFEFPHRAPPQQTNRRATPLSTESTATEKGRQNKKVQPTGTGTKTKKKIKIKITRSNRQKSHIHFFLLGEPRIFEMGGAA